MYSFINDNRFEGIQPLEDRAWLALATLHKEDEMKFVEQVYKENYLTTAGSNVNEMEKTISRYMSTAECEKHAVALVNGTSAIHLAVKLAAEKIYGSATGISTPDGKVNLSLLILSMRHGIWIQLRFVRRLRYIQM